MKKVSSLWLFIRLLTLVVFNALFYIFRGFDNPASVWISYGAIHLSFLLLWLRPLMRGGSFNVYGLGAAAMFHSYCLAELAVGLVFIVLAPADWKIAFAVQLLVLFVFAVNAAVGFIGGIHARDGAPLLDELDAQVRQDDHINTAMTKIKIAYKTTTDMAFKVQLCELLEHFGAYPPTGRVNSRQFADLVSPLVTAAAVKNQDQFSEAKAALLAYVGGKDCV